MKKLLFIILLFSLNASAAKYYVKVSGGTGSGLDDTNAWSYSKFNSATLADFDSVYFKKGESSNIQITNIHSNVYYGYYGTGSMPELTGFRTATMTNQGGNIWKGIAIGGVVRQNTVLIDGKFRSKGRYPDSTYLYTSNAADSFTRIVTSLHATNCVGGELVTHAYNWIIDVNKVKAQSGDTLYLDSAVTYNLTNYNYFIQNLPSLCHKQYDWSINNDTITVYSTTTPLVQYSSIDTLINIQGKRNVTIDGLSITGANTSAIHLNKADSAKIINCNISFTGGSNPQPQSRNGLAGAAIRADSSNHVSIIGDSITNSLNNGISFIYKTDSAYIYNNYIKNTSLIAGLGAGGNNAGMAINVSGIANHIELTRIDSTGYVPIYFTGGYDTLYRNHITNFAANKEDGGGIYTAHGAPGSLIRSNIVKGGIGNVFIAAPLYIDDNSYGITADSNTLVDGRNFGLFLHIFNKITLRNNTVITDRGIAFGTEGSSSNGGSGPSYIYNNIFYSTNSTNTVMKYGYTASPTGYYYSDSNYYLRPIAPTNKIYNAVTGLSYNTAAAWGAAYGLDANSHDAPSGITGTGILHYNATLSPVTEPLTGAWIDAKGAAYSGGITLQPYTSAILFYASSQPTQLPKLRGLKFKTVKKL